MKKIIFLIVTVFIVLTFGGCTKKNSLKSKKHVLKIAHGDPTNSPYQYLAESFKEELAKLTDQIDVKIYPSGQISSEQKAFQDVQNQVIQGAVLASNNASVFAQSLTVLDFPYIFVSDQDFYKILDPLGAKLEKILNDESGTIPITWGTQGFRVLANSKKQVEKLDDLKGLKIRVPGNPLQIATFKSWGNEPIGLSFNELFSALQQGVVDGLEMTYAGLASQKMYEVIQYVTDVRYKLAINPLVISTDWFESLPEDLQKDIRKAGSLATKTMKSRIRNFGEEGKTTLKDNGVLLFGSPLDEEQWISRARGTWPKFYSLIHDPEILDEVLAILKISKP